MTCRLLLASILAVSLPVTSAFAAVVIDETFASGAGEFTVTVDTNDPVLDVGWFAVKNNAAEDAAATRFGWTAEVISAADWAAGYPFYLFGTLDTSDYPWPELTNDPNGQAFFYYAIYLGGGTGGSPIDPGTSQDGFTFATALPGSPFIAGNGNGDIVVYGNTVAAVPVPPMVLPFAIAWCVLRRVRAR